MSVRLNDAEIFEFALASGKIDLAIDISGLPREHVKMLMKLAAQPAYAAMFKKIIANIMNEND